MKKLNQYLSISQEARNAFQNFCQKVDNQVSSLDQNNLLLPGHILSRSWMLSFKFCPAFKKILWEKFSPDAKIGYHGFDRMNREELEDYVAEKKLDIDVDEYSDEPLEELVDAIKGEVGLYNFEEPDEEKDCLFDRMGLFVWKPTGSENAMISVFIEMDSDDSSWPLIKKVAEKLNGKIHLQCDTWSFYEIEFKSFSLADEVDYKAVAQAIVDVADNLWDMAEAE